MKKRRGNSWARRSKPSAGDPTPRSRSTSIAGCMQRIRSLPTSHASRDRTSTTWPRRRSISTQSSAPCGPKGSSPRRSSKDRRGDAVQFSCARRASRPSRNRSLSSRPAAAKPRTPRALARSKQRGAALTNEGRALYDRLLSAAQTKSIEVPSSSNAAGYRARARSPIRGLPGRLRGALGQRTGVLSISGNGRGPASAAACGRRPRSRAYWRKDISRLNQSFTKTFCPPAPPAYFARTSPIAWRSEISSAPVARVSKTPWAAPLSTLCRFIARSRQPRWRRASRR